MKLRIRWVKQGRIRFISHRDAARVWERSLRRARLPVVYSQGFAPRPRMSFGFALATGQESLAEYLDIELSLDFVPDSSDAASYASELPERLSSVLPAGMDAVAAAPLAPGAESLQEAVGSSTWEVELGDLTPESVRVWKEELARLEAASSLTILRERKGIKRETDVKGCIINVELAVDSTDSTGAGRLVAELGSKPQALRPDEFLGLLNVQVGTNRLVRRTHQWITRNGAKCEPLKIATEALKGLTRLQQAVSAAQKKVCA